MKSTGTMPRRRLTSGLYKAVALFFLAFTAFDLASPDICSEDIVGLPAHVFASTREAAERRNPVMSATTSDRTSDSPATHDEDCFCCCTHLIAPAVFRPAIFSPIVSQTSATCQLTMEPPSPGLFRPPRFV